MPNPNLVILTIDNCRAAHTDMTITGLTTCPVCGAELPKVVLVSTEAGPQYAWENMLNRKDNAGTQLAMQL